MKNLIKFMFLFLALGFAVASCSDDDDETGVAPTITNFELGSGHGDAVNNGQAYIGRDFHIAGTIKVADNKKIAQIIVSIQKEGESKIPTEGWQYTEFAELYAGQINADFHEHIIVDRNAEAGKYHFHFVVTDTEGLTAKIDRELEILTRKK